MAQTLRVYLNNAATGWYNVPWKNGPINANSVVYISASEFETIAATEKKSLAATDKVSLAGSSLVNSGMADTMPIGGSKPPLGSIDTGALLMSSNRRINASRVVQIKNVVPHDGPHPLNPIVDPYYVRDFSDGSESGGVVFYIELNPGYGRIALDITVLDAPVKAVYADPKYIGPN